MHLLRHRLLDRCPAIRIVPTERCRFSLELGRRVILRERTEEVAPFVFRIAGARPETTPNYEVAEVIWLPLAELSSPERKRKVTLTHESNTFTMPAIRVGEHKIWGLTYGILSKLLSETFEDK